ncbi:nitroreductase [bacterium]|nr:MAG: nitroreductase [bacterium]
MDDKLKTFYELYDRRKSIREFGDAPVPDDVLSRLLNVLNRAQSAANRQPWHFVVIDNKDRKRFNETFTKEGFKKAPIVIVACADPLQAWVRKTDSRNYAWVDVSIAVTEMIGAATAEGLGCCWVAAIDAQQVKEIVGIPGHMDVVAVIAVGYPVVELKKEEKTRKPLKEIIHYGRW